ncbi:MAG: hypothetical protein AAGJ29_12150 [Pseudomonadota bacterium]
MTQSLTNKISALLVDNGPMLGKELMAHLDGTDYLSAWQACFKSEELQLSQFSRYYLRFDKTRDDMIRLSPSILRDFLSFTLVSLPDQRDGVLERLIRLSNEHMYISRWKIGLGRKVLADVFDRLSKEESEHICAFLAGDLAYYLGHNEPREVEAVGEMVRGSDIDIVIVYDGLDEGVIRQIDQQMLTAKNYLMRSPDSRQELDFVVKPLKTMRQQFDYGTISEKIASKIVFESLFMAGSVGLYETIMDTLEFTGTRGRIEADFEKGLADRAAALSALLAMEASDLTENAQSLFYFSQERVEFE